MHGYDGGLRTLVSSCVALGVDCARVTDSERAQVVEAIPFEVETQRLRQKILAGDDPLGEMFCALRSSSDRRTAGQTFTPL